MIGGVQCCPVSPLPPFVFGLSNPQISHSIQSLVDEQGEPSWALGMTLAAVWHDGTPPGRYTGAFGGVA